MTHCPIERLTQDLRYHLEASHVVVKDHSHKHIGHAGHQPGTISHLDITLSSPQLQHLSRIAQHRRIYDCVKQSIGEVHAVSIHVC